MRTHRGTKESLLCNSAEAKCCAAHPHVTARASGARWGGAIAQQDRLFCRCLPSISFLFRLSRAPLSQNKRLQCGPQQMRRAGSEQAQARGTRWRHRLDTLAPQCAARRSGRQWRRDTRPRSVTSHPRLRTAQSARSGSKTTARSATPSAANALCCCPPLTAQTATARPLRAAARRLGTRAPARRIARASSWYRSPRA